MSESRERESVFFVHVCVCVFTRVLCVCVCVCVCARALTATLTHRGLQFKRVGGRGINAPKRNFDLRTARCFHGFGAGLSKFEKVSALVYFTY